MGGLICIAAWGGAWFGLVVVSKGTGKVCSESEGCCKETQVQGSREKTMGERHAGLQRLKRSHLGPVVLTPASNGMLCSDGSVQSTHRAREGSPGTFRQLFPTSADPDSAEHGNHIQGLGTGDGPGSSWE